MDGGEGVAISDVVDDNDTVSTLVVARRDRLEALLTGRIPDLKLADLVIDIDGANLEVNTDGWHEVLLELIILSAYTHSPGQSNSSRQRVDYSSRCGTYSESEEEAGFTDTRVTNHEHLEQVVAKTQQRVNHVSMVQHGNVW